MVMFVMSLGEFGGTYESFENSSFSAMLKVIVLRCMSIKVSWFTMGWICVKGNVVVLSRIVGDPCQTL